MRGAKGGSIFAALPGGFLGGVIGAAAVFALIYYGNISGLRQMGATLAEFSAQIQAQETAMAALRAEHTQTQGKTTAIAQQLETLTSGWEADMAALTRRLEAQSAQQEDLALRIDTLEAQPEAGADRSVAAIATLEREVDTLKAAQATGKPDAPTRQGDAAEATPSDTEAAAQQAQAQAALLHLLTTLESGMPYGAALQALHAASSLTPAPELEQAADSGLPRLTDLRTTFPDYARAALAAARAAPEPPSPEENRLMRFFKTRLQVRALTAQAGSHADAVLSRAQAALAQDQLPLALAELAALPPAARTAMTPWIEKATLRHQALRAAHTLAQRLNPGQSAQ